LVNFLPQSADFVNQPPQQLFRNATVRLMMRRRVMPRRSAFESSVMPALVTALVPALVTFVDSLSMPIVAAESCLFAVGRPMPPISEASAGMSTSPREFTAMLRPPVMRRAPIVVPVVSRGKFQIRFGRWRLHSRRFGNWRFAIGRGMLCVRDLRIRLDLFSSTRELD
jgi:hypothetical protein